VPHGQRDGSLRPYSRISRPELCRGSMTAPVTVQMYPRDRLEGPKIKADLKSMIFYRMTPYSQFDLLSELTASELTREAEDASRGPGI
jgi:hypothetical protein